MLNSSQTMVASYRYDPFGNTISSSGTLANANVYRFSSKEIHPNSGMYYYGFRFYDPNLQRWINRDPLGEIGLMQSMFRRAPWMALSSTSDINRSTALYHPPAILTLNVQPSQSQLGGLDENQFSYVANCPVTILDPLGLSSTNSFNWCSFWGWGVAGAAGGWASGIKAGPVQGAWGAAGGFIAGAGGYSLDYFFNNFDLEQWLNSGPEISHEQFEKNYGTLPGKYQ